MTQREVIRRNILTVDQGNTLVKLTLWRLGADGATPDEVTWRAAFSPDESDEMFAWVESLAPECGVYCSVGRMDVRLIESLRCQLGDSLLVMTHSTPLPVGIDYRTPGTLGADRVALAAGASTLFPGQRCVIADAGTALTVDLLTDDGTFCGGRISPGLRLRFDALHRHTLSLPLLDADRLPPVAGYDTDSSIRSGVMRGMAAEIAAGFREMKADRAILTGGDAKAIAPLLLESDTAFITEPDLMSRGLIAIFNHNDDNTHDDNA